MKKRTKIILCITIFLLIFAAGIANIAIGMSLISDNWGYLTGSIHGFAAIYICSNIIIN